MAALSRFVSAGGDRGHPYFQCLKRNNRFVWTKECEESFLKLKEYLASPQVLCKPLLGTPTPFELRYYRAGDKFCPRPGAWSRAKAHILCQQSFAWAWGEIPGHRKGSPSDSVLNAKAPPLLPKFHCYSDDRPPYSQSLTKSRCGRADGVLGGWVIRVGYTVRTKRNYQRPCLC